MTFAAWLVPLLWAAAPNGVVEGTVKFETRSLVGTSETRAGEAVVFLEQLEGEAPAPTEKAVMAQKNKAFDPRLLVVMEGSKVEFPNEDLIYHNVFSLSKGNEFDLGVYRVGTSKTVRFAKPGVVDVFCNIHPEMIATILVLQNRYFARVGPDGHFRLEVPAGKRALGIYWTQGVTDRKEIDLAAGATATVDFSLVDVGRTTRHLNKLGQQYGRYK